MKEDSTIISGTPPTVESTHVVLELDIDVRSPAGSGVESIESPSHPISVSTVDPSTTKITLANPAARLNKDFILLLRLPNSDRPKCIVEFDKATNSYAAALSLVPRFALLETATPKELIFVIDRSGSMEGNSIENAKQALLLMLRSLPADGLVKFNIVSFGSNFKSLWPEAKTYSEQTMKEAEREVKSMSADMGGTELLQPIQAILEGNLTKGFALNNMLPKKRGRDDKVARSIMVLTDGEIWNTADLLQLVSSHAKSGNTRVFALGIGNAVSTHLVKGIARCGNGIAEFVGDGERMEKKVIKLVKISLADGVRNLKIDWGKIEEPVDRMEVDSKPPSYTTATTGGGSKKLSFFSDEPIPDVEVPKGVSLSIASAASFQQAPHLVPALYASSRYTVYAFLRSPGMQGGQPPKTVKITGQVADNEIELEIPVTVIPEEQQSERTVHVLGAKRLIQDLQESASYLHDPVTGELASGVHASEVTRELVRLGTTFQLSSTETSWIAIDPQTNVEVSQVVNTIVPQEFEEEKTRRAYAMPQMAQMLSSNMPMPMPASVGSTKSRSSGFFGFLSGVGASVAAAPALFSRGAGAPAPPPPARFAAAPGGGARGGRGSISLAKKSKAPFIVAEASAPEAPYDMMVDSFAMDQDDACEKLVSGGEGGAVAQEELAGKGSNTRAIFTKLVSLQQFDGSWTDPSQVASTCGIALNPTPAGIDAQVWATMIAVAFLETRLGEFKDEWELIVDKARKWISSKVGQGGAAEAWKAAQSAVAV